MMKTNPSGEIINVSENRGTLTCLCNEEAERFVMLKYVMHSLLETAKFSQRFRWGGRRVVYT